MRQSSSLLGRHRTCMEPKRRRRVCWFPLLKIPSSIPSEFHPSGSTLGMMHHVNSWCQADIINSKFQAYLHLLMTHSSYHSVNFIELIKFQPLFMLPISDSWVITCGFAPGLWDEDLSLQVPSLCHDPSPSSSNYMRIEIAKKWGLA